MIPVDRQPEPSNFNKNVRQPGKRFLAKKPTKSSKKFANYWRFARKDLHEAYKRICSYTCFYMPDTGTVDHFLPKSLYPNLAYEWDNYRLATPRVNQHKGNSTNIIDPFIVQSGWFVLDFPSCLIRSGYGLSKLQAKQVTETISALKLNDDDNFVQERCDIMLEFAEGNFDLDYLSRRYPFLASEIVRQGMRSNANSIFKRRHN